MKHIRHRRGYRGARQSGSAYAMTMMALLVLTVLSLSLIAVTQSELVMGAAEQTRQKVFYAAESGIAIATARALVSNDRRPVEIVFDDTPDPSPGVVSPRVTQLNHIDISPFYPVLDVPCNFCEINSEGTYRRTSYRKVNHAVTVTATRMGTGGEVIARKTLSTMVEFQPWIVTNDAFGVIDDPEELAKIRF